MQRIARRISDPLPPRPLIVAQVGRILSRVDVSEPVARVMAVHAYGLRRDEGFMAATSTATGAH